MELGNPSGSSTARALFSMEQGIDEYLQKKYKPKDELPAPLPYSLNDPDWSKASEAQRLSCELTENSHLCVILEVPLKKWLRNGRSNITNMVDGKARIAIDTEIGVILSLRVIETMERRVGGPYQTEVIYSLRSMHLNLPEDANLFTLPGGMKEVKEFSRWNASKINKQFMGKAAPALEANDLQGMPVSLSDLKGKTVLLDFWTTWCPACWADRPALNRLYSKYGERDLEIIGISVNEDRVVVERYLKQFPMAFRIVLTTENEMSHAYNVTSIPMYVLIERDGTISTVIEGDQGFGELRKLLKKAGMEVE